MEMEDYILYICVPCKTRITNYDSIVDHFEQFHSDKNYGEENWDEESQTYGIDLEDEEGDEELEEYLENHTYKRCGICPTSSGLVHSFRHADLWNHLIIDHKYYYGRLEIYKCKICDKEFAYKKLLEDHFMPIHGINEHKSKNYFKFTIRKCGLCKKDFTSSKLLEDHFANNYGLKTVSYTHLTLPTICSV